MVRNANWGVGPLALMVDRCVSADATPEEVVVPLHTADGRIYPTQMYVYQLGKRKAILRTQACSTPLAPTPSTAVEFIIHRKTLPPDSNWEQEARGTRADVVKKSLS